MIIMCMSMYHPDTIDNTKKNNWKNDKMVKKSTCTC